MRRRPIECTLMDHSFRASSCPTPRRTWITQDALLDMIHAIDADMHARPGDAELTPWLLVLHCAPQHVAKEFRSVMRDTRPHIKLCHVQRNFTEYTPPLDRAYMRAFKNSIRQEAAKHFAEFFLEVESNFEHVNLDSSTAVLRQLLLSFVHTAIQNADSPQHRAAGCRFSDWNDLEQCELLAEAKRPWETRELFPHGTAERARPASIASLSFVVASLSIHSICLIVVSTLYVFHQFHRLH